MGLEGSQGAVRAPSVFTRTSAHTHVTHTHVPGQAASSAQNLPKGRRGTAPATAPRKALSARENLRVS